MTATAIEVEGLRKSFGEVNALDGLDLVGPEGAVLALLGPNGAGKTTLVRALATLLGRPRVLFLDEPTTGLDPRSRAELWELIGELRARGTTFLLTTQYLEEADRLAQLIAVIDQGRIVAEGTARELKERVGHDRVIVRVSDAGRTDDARAALAALASDGPPEVRGDAELSLPMTDSDIPAAAVRALDRAGVGVAGLEVRTPTLDDVFLTLTGRRVAAEETEEMAA